MAGKIKTFFYAVGAGATGYALAHFLDPDLGRTRRARAKDQLAARAREGADQLRKEGIQVADKAQGKVAETVSRAVPDVPPNDPTLQHKVESEVLGGERFPKGKISVNAEDGKIVLRGELDQPDLIRELEASVRQIDGVRDVENLVHLPNQPAPEHR